MRSDIYRKAYRIEEADGAAKYEGLRSLWCEVFGDGPEYVDFTYDNFGDDIRGYVVTDEDGKVVSALTKYRCGEYEGNPVFVSYAVCTAEESRGLGLAGMLTDHVRDLVESEGGISIVSPSEESLVGFYAGHGYEPYFFASERAVLSPDLDMDDYDDFDDYDADFVGGEPGNVTPELEMKSIGAEVYGRYREAFLTGRPHIELSGRMLRMAEAESLGGRGLFSVNNGDAICAVSEVDAARVLISELIVNPVLLEISADIDAVIASMIAKHFNAAETVYRTPGMGSCQSMAGTIPRGSGEDRESKSDNNGKNKEEYEYLFEEAYYGFPVE